MKIENTQAVARFTALGNDTRLAIYRWLLPFNPQGRAFGEIALGLGLADATLAFHLKELAHTGLIQSRPEGRKVIYSVNVDTVTQLIEFLLENCCANAPRDMPGAADCAACPPAATPSKPKSARPRATKSRV